MKKPRVEDFDPKQRGIRPEKVNLDNLPVIKRPSSKKAKRGSGKKGGSDDTTIPRYHGIMKPRNHDTTVSRYHDTTTPSFSETIRKAVTKIGKEAATHRFTPEEKQEIADIVYAYSRIGYRTSENEIARIAINWLIQDYKQHGKNSVLEQTMKALKE